METTLATRNTDTILTDLSCAVVQTVAGATYSLRAGRAGQLPESTRAAVPGQSEGERTGEMTDMICLGMKQ